jgi:hypothetical protein
LYLFNRNEELIDKENNKKKINERIDGKDKDKYKIKYEEIEICPID